MSSVMVELDDESLALAEKHAAIAGRPREEIIAEAVRRGLATGDMRAILTAGRTGAEISERDAMEMALEEQRRYRPQGAADKNSTGR